jgi:hypothetical protein
MASTAQLDSEFRDLQADLRQLEAYGDDRGSHFWQQTNAEWHIQMETVQRDLSRLEQSVFDDFQPKGEER